MNFVISIIHPAVAPRMNAIMQTLELPLSIELLGRGTATKNVLDLLGLSTHEYHIVMTIADRDRTAKLIEEARRNLYIDAPGQGIIAVQGRKGDFEDRMQRINCRESQLAAICERSFVRALDGGCSSPIAAYAEIKGEEIVLNGMYASMEYEIVRKGRVKGHISEAEALGRQLARQLKG